MSTTTLLRDRIGSPYPPWRRPDCPLPVTQKEVEDYLQSVLDTSAVLERIQKRRATQQSNSWERHWKQLKSADQLKVSEDCCKGKPLQASGLNG